MHSVSANDPIQKIETRLAEKGVQINEISIDKEEGVLSVETVKDSNSKKSNIENIKAERAIKNEVRGQGGEDAQIKGLNLTVKDLEKSNDE